MDPGDVGICGSGVVGLREYSNSCSNSNNSNSSYRSNSSSDSNNIVIAAKGCRVWSVCGWVGRLLDWAHASNSQCCI